MDDVAIPTPDAVVGLLITAGIYWLVYCLVLFLLMKVQGWRVGAAALMGSTLLASILAQIPLVGPYVSTLVLVFCIWKASHSDLTDTVFSVVIAGAVMFAFQIFALTALVGSLRPNLVQAELEEEAELVEPGGLVQVAATRAWSLGGDTPLLYFKGITLSTNGHLVLVGSGTSNHSFRQGEIKRISTSDGGMIVECELIRSNGVIMKVNYKDQQYRVPLVPDRIPDVAP